MNIQEKIQIKDVLQENLSDLDKICMPFLNKVKDKSNYLAGIEKRNNWYLNMMEKYGPLAKIAYWDDCPVGMIQFIPRTSEQIIDIQCVFILDKFAGKGVGSSLLKKVIDELNGPQVYFDNKPPKALTTWAFYIPGFLPQKKLFKKFGFVESQSGKPLYLPIEKGYEYFYMPDKKIRGLSSDKKAITVLDTSCPFCVFTINRYKKIFKEIAPEITIEIVNKFEVSSETKRMIDFCELNKKKIVTAFAKEEVIKESIKATLGNKK